MTLFDTLYQSVPPRALPANSFVPTGFVSASAAQQASGPASLATIHPLFLDRLLESPGYCKPNRPIQRAASLAIALSLPKTLPLEVVAQIVDFLPAADVNVKKIALSRMSAQGQNESLGNIAYWFRMFDQKPAQSSWLEYLTNISTQMAPDTILDSGRPDALAAAVFSERLPAMLVCGLFPDQTADLQSHLWVATDTFYGRHDPSYSMHFGRLETLKQTESGHGSSLAHKLFKMGPQGTRLITAIQKVDGSKVICEQTFFNENARLAKDPERLGFPSCRWDFRVAAYANPATEVPSSFASRVVSSGASNFSQELQNLFGTL